VPKRPRRTALSGNAASASASGKATIKGTYDKSSGVAPTAAGRKPVTRSGPQRTLRDSRGNFVRTATSGSRPKHSFGFQGRSAAGGRALKVGAGGRGARIIQSRGGPTKAGQPGACSRAQASLTRRRRVINGKVVIMGGKAPHAAGQGADFAEGFAQGTRCFRCGIAAGGLVHNATRRSSYAQGHCRPLPMCSAGAARRATGLVTVLGLSRTHLRMRLGPPVRLRGLAERRL
jgi:hypothetical protein